MKVTNDAIVREGIARIFCPLEMTRAEFNSFSKEFVGIGVQEGVTEFLQRNNPGSYSGGAGIDNSLRTYARETAKPHNFFRLARALRNREIVRDTWTDKKEKKFRRLIGLVEDEYKSSFAPWDEDEIEFGGKGYGVYDRIRDERHDAKADEHDATMRTGLADIQALIQAQGADISATRADAAYLAKYRKGQTEKNRKRGAENQAKGNNEERDCAAKDMTAALDRVRDKVKDMEKNGKRANVVDVCRAVCKEFKRKSSRKDPLTNKCADGYYPLTGAGGTAIKPETLAKNYRERYGTKKKKAAAAK